MKSEPEIWVGAGEFVLPDGSARVQSIAVHRNDQGQISELIIRFDPSLQGKLQSQRSVPFLFLGTGERIDVPIPAEFCGWSEATLKQGSQHLHVAPLGLDQFRKVERFQQYVAALAG